MEFKFKIKICRKCWRGYLGEEYVYCPNCGTKLGGKEDDVCECPQCTGDIDYAPGELCRSW